MTKQILSGAVTGLIMLLAGLLWGNDQSGNQYSKAAENQQKVQEKILDKLNTIDKTSTTTQTDVKYLTKELNKLSEKVESNSKHIYEIKTGKQ